MNEHERFTAGVRATLPVNRQPWQNGCLIDDAGKKIPLDFLSNSVAHDSLIADHCRASEVANEFIQRMTGVDK